VIAGNGSPTLKEAAGEEKLVRPANNAVILLIQVNRFMSKVVLD